MHDSLRRRCAAAFCARWSTHSRVWRVIGLASLLLIGGLPLAWAQKPADQPPYRLIAPKAEIAWREVIRKAFEIELELHFDNIPLNEAVDEFKKKLHIEIQLDQRALEASGVGFDKPVEYHCAKTTPAGGSFRAILKEFDLIYTLQSEVVLITAAEEVAGRNETRIYPVRDLITRDRHGRRTEDYVALIKMVRSLIQKPSVSDKNDSIKADCINGELAVAATCYEQEQITDLLLGLRQLRKLTAVRQ